MLDRPIDLVRYRLMDNGCKKGLEECDQELESFWPVPTIEVIHHPSCEPYGSRTLRAVQMICGAFRVQHLIFLSLDNRRFEAAFVAEATRYYLLLGRLEVKFEFRTFGKSKTIDLYATLDAELECAKEGPPVMESWEVEAASLNIKAFRRQRVR